MLSCSCWSFFLVFLISLCSFSSGRSHSARSLKSSSLLKLVVSNSTISNSSSNQILGNVITTGNQTRYNLTMPNGISVQIFKEGPSVVDLCNLTLFNGTSPTISNSTGSSSTTSISKKHKHKHKHTSTSSPSATSSGHTSKTGSPKPSSTGSSNSSDDLFQKYRRGANSYYLYALQADDRTAILDAMQDAEMKTVRIFITGILENNKGSGNSAVPDRKFSAYTVFMISSRSFFDQSSTKGAESTMIPFLRQSTILWSMLNQEI
jgi:hypothetical protein